MDEDQPVTAPVIEGLATANELASELRDGESQPSGPSPLPSGAEVPEKPGLTQAVEQGCYDAVREFVQDLMISLTEQLSTEAVAKETEAAWQQLADDGDELAMQLAHIASAVQGVPISAVATVVEASAEALLRAVNMVVSTSANGEKRTPFSAFSSCFRSVVAGCATLHSHFLTHTHCSHSRKHVTQDRIGQVSDLQGDRPASPCPERRSRGSAA